MAHRIIVDHRNGSRWHIDRALDGRIKSEYESISPETRLALAREISGAVAGEAHFEAGARALYATDASNYRQAPIGVVVAKTLDDVCATVAICHRNNAPLVMRGGGTSLAGQGCNVAVLVDFSKYLDHVLWLDPDRKLAEVEPGCILDTLRDRAEAHHLTFGPDPSTHDHNTLGGMIGNNSCGVHSVMAGRTSDNVEQLDILTYDGLRMTVGRTSDDELQSIIAAGGRKAEIYGALDAFRKKYGDMIRARFPKIPRRVSGFENLDELLPEKGFNVARALVGTEATCVTVLKAVVNLVHSPPERVLAVIGFSDVYDAADAVVEVLTFNPIGLEGMDELLVKFVRKTGVHAEGLTLLPGGEGWLIAEFGADKREEAVGKARKLIDVFRAKRHDARLVDNEADQRKMWRLREAALGVTAHVAGMPETFEGWEDSAVPRDKLGPYLRDLKALFHRHGYDDVAVYGHFGDGLIHCRVPFGLRTEAGLANWQSFLEKAADLVVSYGGSLSGEHGDGQARGALLERMYGRELIRAFSEFKAIWDPAGQMNPGKVVEPFPITSNLRYGPEYQPPEVPHFFAYEEDGGSFTKATRRCVGVGACRRVDSDEGVMCPSYMATREEKYSTRGRARLLFEMLHGGLIDNGWRSREVEDALDLCLACKGCKSDCPVHVDMATYKAEFRAHHYAWRPRPRAAYSMGLIHRWSQIASAVPALANALTQSAVLAPLTKWIGDVAPQRRMPTYARESFRRWRSRNPGEKGVRGRLLLWPDTFNNYFRPSTAIAATRSLEALGYEVAIPRRSLCCGRPLYDWGMLDAAKKLWGRTIDALLPEIEAGTPIIGLEPACVSAFRDELPNLLHGDERAERLSGQTFFFSEFLDRHPEGLENAKVRGHGLAQLHCHHHAVLDHEAESRLLRRLEMNVEMLPSGCCGMAGSFGFETKKYEVSMTAAERVLLPAVRAAAQESIILANGFSCREQIEQGSGRNTTHIAELAERAICARRGAANMSTRLT